MTDDEIIAKYLANRSIVDVVKEKLQNDDKFATAAALKYLKENPADTGEKSDIEELEVQEEDGLPEKTSKKDSTVVLTDEYGYNHIIIRDMNKLYAVNINLLDHTYIYLPETEDGVQRDWLLKVLTHFGAKVFFYK